MLTEVRHRHGIADVLIRVEVLRTEATQLDYHPVTENIVQLLTELAILAKVCNHFDASILVAIGAPFAFEEEELRHLWIE